MTGLWPVLATLLSHWRRQPVQLLALLAGLAVATALWSGVQALNAEARASYDAGAAVLGGDRFARIEATDGLPLNLDDYARLRRDGWAVSPVIEGTWVSGGRGYRLIGIEPLSVPDGALGAGAVGAGAALAGFVTPPYRLIGAPETIADLDGPDLPETTADAGLPAGVLIADIALAEDLLGRRGEIDRLILTPAGDGATTLADLSDRLVLRPAEEEPELARLTDSFHLNLTAFGTLSFVVGLFIVHATIGLAFEQRRAMVRTLRAIGTAQRTLTAALLAELLVLAAAGAAIGMALGYLLAAALLPDVAASLRGLYGAAVPGELTLRPAWWLAGAGMALAGTLAAAAAGLWKLHRLPILAAAQAEAWHGAQIRSLRLQGALAIALAAVAGFAALSPGLLAGFALMGGVLMAAALLLPLVLAGLLTLLRRRQAGPVGDWFVAESRAQLGGLSLALMALLLALAVNIGVSTMVSSFRVTFLGWIDQRLSADIYVRGEDSAEADRIVAFLGARDDVTAVLPVQWVDLDRAGHPFELYGIRDNAMYRENWPLIAPLANPWDRVASGNGVMVSEQFARRAGLAPGDPFPLPGQGAGWAPEVVALYPDYGNPIGQAIISNARLVERWPGLDLTRFAVRTAPGAATDVRAALEGAFALGPQQAVDQAALKTFSRQVFERTFSVTLALNVLTFAVAGLALFTSLLTLAEMRLPQVAPLWALGLTRGTLVRLELARAVLLALTTAILAVPLGILVAWILLAVVNVEAFGWRIPLRHYPSQWLALGALAVATALAAAALPARRLGRTPPAPLLKVFADAR